MSTRRPAYFVHHIAAEDIEVIRQSLLAAVEGDFFPEWEFGTLFGLERDEVRRVYETWPMQDVSNEDLNCAVVNALNNLLGYPHGLGAMRDAYVDGGAAAIRQTLDRIHPHLDRIPQ